MFAALLTTFLLAGSAICGHRTSRQIGGFEANFWRIMLAAIFLTLWANIFGTGLEGAPGWFMLSGLCGIGLGDTAYFQALPRLGSRRAVLLTQCLTAPFAALIEWLWLGTRLHLPVLLCIAVILTGVAIALAPREHLEISRHDLKNGVVASVLAAFGSALGAVLSRKAYAVCHALGAQPDPGTTGWQRVLGGILLPMVLLLMFKGKSIGAQGGVFGGGTMEVARKKWRRLWPWALGNALAGQTFGETTMQWALERTPTGIVTAIIATTPVILLPMTLLVDGESIGWRPLVGGVIAVGGVVALTLCR